MFRPDYKVPVGFKHTMTEYQFIQAELGAASNVIGEQITSTGGMKVKGGIHLQICIYKYVF